MYRLRLSHILLCGLILSFFVACPEAAQQAAPKIMERPLKLISEKIWQKWLDEDVVYIITDQERAEFKKLTADQQHDKFIEDFWEHRNPNPGSPENTFKEEHYRRIAYANEHFAANVPGWKTDRGRIYIIYGAPDERVQHPGNADTGLPASAPLAERFPSDIWRYHIIKGVGRDVFFEFIDTCRCGEYPLCHDPTKKRPPSANEKEKPGSTTVEFPRRYRKWMTVDAFCTYTDQERADLGGYCKSSPSGVFDLRYILNLPQS